MDALSAAVNASTVVMIFMVRCSILSGGPGGLIKAAVSL
jgi:hypothetical protein